jgi:hypothetical protein
MVVLGGDFRQNLPVYKRGTRGQIVANTVLKAPWWSAVRKYRLTENMRVLRMNNSLEAKGFAEFLLSVGEGQFLCDIDDVTIQLPQEHIFQGDNINEFIKWVYPDISAGRIPDVDGRAILTTLNQDVNEANEIALGMMQGASFLAFSSDSIANDKENSQSLHFPYIIVRLYHRIVFN